MRALEKIEEALLQDDLGDEVEWYETSVCHRFQAGLRRSLDVHLDHLNKEITQEDFNTIPEHVPGAWACQRHSWMFHDLYDHHGLSLAEICKIVSWSFTLVRGYSFSTIIHP
ncbi:hypothetical protein [Acidithiobacillus caldus]|nr:hypothetical protein [Acidithiobacillus caldus]OFC35022.1 hypothetical protein BAE28_11520 [Acidithiobacillus caldus]